MLLHCGQLITYCAQSGHVCVKFTHNDFEMYNQLSNQLTVHVQVGRAPKQ